MFLFMTERGTTKHLATAAISLAHVRGSTAIPCSVRLHADGNLPAPALDVLADLIRRAKAVIEASNRRPEGMQAPLEEAEFVRWLTDGQTVGNPDSQYPVTRPRRVPAGSYGYSPRAYWDWDAGKVIYAVPVLAPGACHRSRLATEDEMEIYEGDPYKGDPDKFEVKRR